MMLEVGGMYVYYYGSTPDSMRDVFVVTGITETSANHRLQLGFGNEYYEICWLDTLESGRIYDIDLQYVLSIEDAKK